MNARSPIAIGTSLQVYVSVGRELMMMLRAIALAVLALGVRAA
jgi:hypothetical protein